MSAREALARYGFFFGIMVALGTTSAALVRIRSGFVYPPFFDLFRALFFLQYGLFGGMTLATLLVLVPIWMRAAISTIPSFSCWAIMARNFRNAVN